jgi:conjugal transfer pilin signal peptidase TrbI
MNIDHGKKRKNLVWASLLVALLAVNYYWFKSPITIGFDPNDEKCIPDMHLSLLVKQKPTEINQGDLLFWKPTGPLGYIKQEYVLKRVSGVPGDHLQVKEGNVLINGKLVVQGLPLVDVSKVSLTAFDRDEVIPAGFIFMTGSHPLSNDSRYWGYLSADAIVGKGYKIL